MEISDNGLPIAHVRYNQVVVWKKPGGHHHVKILKRGDTVNILSGWKYDERTWKDKNYIKVLVNNSIGYVLAAPLSDIKPPIERRTEDEPYYDGDDYIS